MNVLQEMTGNATFDSMPGHTRLWIYKVGRALNQSEIEMIRTKGAAFVSTWAAHGQAMQALVDVSHGRLVIIAADEQVANATGCSIDSSVAFVKGLEKELETTLTDRMLLIYESKDGHVDSCTLQQLAGLAKEGIVTEDTIIFDDLVTTKADFDVRFKIPLKDSWAAKFLS